MDYEDDVAKERITDFLMKFYCEDVEGNKVHKYSEAIGRIALRQQIPLYIEQVSIFYQINIKALHHFSLPTLYT